MDLNGQIFSRYKAFVRQVSSISPDVSITIFLMTYPNRLYTGWFTWFAIHIHDDLCVYRYVQIHIDMYRYVQICICMYRYVYGQMCIDMYGFFCTKQAWLLFFSSQNLHNPVKMSQLLLESLRYVQIKYFDYTQLQQILRTQSLCSIVTYTIQNHHVTVTLHHVIVTYTIKNIIYGYSYIYYPKYYIQLQLHILSNIIYIQLQLL